MTFEWSISLGSLLSAAGMLAGGVAFVLALRGDIRVLIANQSAQLTRIVFIEQQLGSMTNVLTQLARQEERLNAIEQQITLLREGFMLPLRRGAHEAPR